MKARWLSLHLIDIYVTRDVYASIKCSDLVIKHFIVQFSVKFVVKCTPVCHHSLTSLLYPKQFILKQLLLFVSIL